MRTDGTQERRLFRNEIGYLLDACEIAEAAGDASNHAVRTLEKICNALKSESRSYAAPTNTTIWQRAIVSAQYAPDSPDVLGDFDPNPRNKTVGIACRGIRDCGFDVQIDSFGPNINEHTQLQIANRVDSMIENVGGVNILMYLFQHMYQHNRLHDDLWLFGNQIAPARSPSKPEIPVGWLISLALRHIHNPPSTPDSGLLKEGISLSINLAAALNCQRYNRFEGVTGIHPTAVIRNFDESIKWHVLFTLPQVPVSALIIIRRAFGRVAWPPYTRQVKHEVDALLQEGIELLRNRKTDRLIGMPLKTAQRRFPLLTEKARAKRGETNSNYLRPFDTEQRDHQSSVFFDSGEDKVIALTPSLAACSVYKIAFETIWSKLQRKVAEPIVSEVSELSIYLACVGKATEVKKNVRYHANGKALEIDVLCRGETDWIIFEAKSKVLTRAAESVNTLAFIKDYVGGFLVALKQLVRHDRNTILGNEEIVSEAGESITTDIIKVAVSSLTFGPVTDKALTNALINAATQVSFEAMTDDVRAIEIIGKFNSIFSEIEDEFDRYPEEYKPEDLFRYMISVFWMDVPQFIYLMGRAGSVEKALQSIQNVTFSSRDFWTEIALLDRSGLTKERLHNPR
ncbi:MAG: hypothetical protein OXG25_06550 [Gammaproteobacteria bacterium]|nr:hypothetical protein [Gammaproteobacteria bacterium]